MPVDLNFILFLALPPTHGLVRPDYYVDRDMYVDLRHMQLCSVKTIQTVWTLIFMQ